MKKKKVTQWKKATWKIDFLNTISEKINEFKKTNNGIFEDQQDFETAMDILHEDIERDIEEIKLDAETILSDEILRVAIFDKLYYDSVNQDEEGTLIHILEMCGYGVVKLESLADEIRFEAIKENIEHNPYQLLLTA